MTEHLGKCPVCFHEERDPVTTKDRYGVSYATWLCHGCALIYADPQRSVEEADRFYAEEYRAQYGNEATCHPLRSLVADSIPTFLRHFSIRPARVLEYGCGRGDWLVELREAFGCEVFGTDADPEMEAIVRAKGISTEVHIDSSMDLIIYNHSLEHVRSPLAHISVAKSLVLAPGGWMFVAVPGLYTWNHKSLWQSAHTVQFTARSLWRLMRRCGMTAIYLDEMVTSLWRRSDDPFDPVLAERWRIIRSLAEPAPEVQ